MLHRKLQLATSFVLVERSSSVSPLSVFLAGLGFVRKAWTSIVVWLLAVSAVPGLAMPDLASSKSNLAAN